MSEKQPQIDALALLTASYEDSLAELIGDVLREAESSASYEPEEILDPRVQELEEDLTELAAQTTTVIDLLIGMTILARLLALKCANMMEIDELDLLEVIGESIDNVPLPEW